MPDPAGVRPGAAPKLPTAAEETRMLELQNSLLQTGYAGANKSGHAFLRTKDDLQASSHCNAVCVEEVSWIE